MTNIELKMTVEGMRYEMVRILAQNRLEFSDKIEDALRAELKDFDFDEILRAEARKVIREESAKAVRSAVTSMLSGIAYDDGMRERFKQAFVESI